MLRVMQLGEEVEETTLDAMEFDKIRWVDCVNPTDAELHSLSQKIYISKRDLERCLDEDERPSAEDLDNFALIVFKSPVRNPASVGTTSFALLISDKLLVTFRKQELHGITKISKSEKLKNIFAKGTTHIAYQILEGIMDDYFAILDFVEDRINTLEDRVFINPEPKLVKEIFALKKTLIYFQKALSANRDVMAKFSKDTGEHVDEKEAKLFRYVADDVMQLIDVVATYRDILTGTLDIYLGSVSNNMNVVMKKMAAFGSVILVPTLIAGIYGMNFVHMPEIYMKYGYPLSLGLMLVSMVGLGIYFKRKDWF